MDKFDDTWWREEIDPVQSLLDRWLGGSQERLAILEAGCGSSTYIKLPINAKVTGLDISSKQLERNSQLHEKILGDIQTYPLESGIYDLVICWDVLEHLDRPVEALRGLWRSVSAGGLLVLGLPNVCSFKGLITKLTPFAFHVWVYRNIFGNEKAGTEDRELFPTPMHLSIAPNAIRRFARDQGASVERFQLYQGPMQKRFLKHHLIIGLLWRLLSWSLWCLSLGKISPSKTDFVVVLSRAKSC